MFLEMIVTFSESEMIFLTCDVSMSLLFIYLKPKIRQIIFSNFPDLRFSARKDSSDSLPPLCKARPARVRVRIVVKRVRMLPF